MSTIYDEYEAVIGLEVHAQLLTKSKAFSNDENSYGNQPNSNISPITLGHPGTLPRMPFLLIFSGLGSCFYMIC